MTPTCRFLTLFGGLGANCSTSIHGRTTTHRKQRSPPRDCLYACLYYFTKHSPHYSFTHAVAVNMVDLLNESDQLFSHFFNITFWSLRSLVLEGTALRKIMHWPNRTTSKMLCEQRTCAQYAYKKQSLEFRNHSELHIVQVPEAIDTMPSSICQSVPPQIFASRLSWW